MGFTERAKDAVKDVHFCLKLVAWLCNLVAMVMFLINWNSHPYNGPGCLYVEAEASINIILMVTFFQYLFEEPPSKLNGLVYSFIGIIFLLTDGIVTIYYSKTHKYSKKTKTVFYFISGIFLIISAIFLLIDVVCYFVKDKVTTQNESN